MGNDPVLAGEAVELPLDFHALGEVHAALDRLEAAAAQVRGAEPDDVVFLGLRTAVVEIAANIIRHAYPAGYTARPFHLQLQLYRDRVEAHYSDEGIPFELPEAPALPPLDDPLAMPEGGFGLFLARQSVDELSYTRTAQGINHWRLMKRFSPPA